MIREFNFWGMFRRKKYHLLVPFLFLMVATVALAFSLPIFYESSTTILVEESNIPEGIVEDNFTGFIDQRLDTITQRIMSRTRLWDIVNRHNLYKDSRENQSKEEIVNRTRENIKLKTISSDAFQAALDMPINGTISFTLSFEDRDRHLAQEVTSELAALYIHENQTNVEKRHDNTVTFLNGEQSLLKKRLFALEAEIANFKTIHIEGMPEQLEDNIQKSRDLEQEIDMLDIDLQTRLRNESEMQGQLMNTSPYSQIIEATGERVLNQEDKLDLLRIEYLEKKATFSSKHPDLIRLKMEIEELYKVVGRRSSLGNMKKHLNDLETEYIKNSGRLGQKHPNMIALSAEIKVIRKELRALENKMEQKQELIARNPDNPAYITLQTDVKTLDLDIEAMKAKRNKLLETLAIVKKHVDNTPKVEKAYLNLTREYEHLKETHTQLLSRITEAKEAQEVDHLETGRRFEVIDEAILPEKPSRPNVPIIFMLGLITSLSISVGVFYISEYMDRSIRNASELTTATGQAVFVSVPYIYDSKDKEKDAFRLIIQTLIILILLAAIILAGNHYYLTYCLPHVT
jgi:uncharacterized protein involved in exopolysaccharide biosynthesis